MSSRPSSPVLGERYDRRRQRVVDIAAKEFAERGYAETSVQQLSEAMDLAAGAIYHYFKGKQDVLIAICDDLVQPLLEQARVLAACAMDPEQRLRELVRLWVAQVVTHREHMLVFQQQRHLVERDPAWRQVRATRKTFERLVEQMLEECTTRPSDRRLALGALLGMVNHTAQWYRPRGHLTSDEIADGYVDLLLVRRDGPVTARGVSADRRRTG